MRDISVNKKNTRMKQIGQVRWLLWLLIALQHVSTGASPKPNVIVIRPFYRTASETVYPQQNYKIDTFHFIRMLNPT
jgi:hypothetical protein